MRLLGLEVAGFRGFAGAQSLDLDADAIVVIGANGNGKTSLFDAVLWGISGRVPRLGTNDQSLVSRFSETGEARVTVRFRQRNATTPAAITRIFDGKETRVSLETADGGFRGPEAEGRLIQMVWKEAAAAANPRDALATVLTRSVYLQQDLVRQFIDSVTEHERFSAVSELVGAGRVTDLQSDLERAKSAWSKTTNSRTEELKPLRNRYSSMEARLRELKSRVQVNDVTMDEAAWKSWWGQLQSLGVKAGPVDIGAREAAPAIDAAINQLEALRKVAERRQNLLDALNRDIGQSTGQTLPELSTLREKIASRKQQLEKLRTTVTAEQARASEVRRLQAELKEKSEQLRALAALALKHLGATCPVCDQQYNVQDTKQRLESLVNGGDAGVSPAPVPEVLPGLLKDVALQEKEVSAAELELRAGEQLVSAYEANEAGIEQRLVALGLTGIEKDKRTAAIDNALSATVLNIDQLAKAQKAGEEFSLAISQTGDRVTIQELEKELLLAGTQLLAGDTDTSHRAATGELAQRVIEALREAASSVVTARVKEIEPLLSDIYSRIDVHPAFRVVRFLASVVRGKGQLSTVVSDPLSDIDCDSPSEVLSSSQMNVLAVCTFLSLNLGVAQPPLEAALLDDPLQSLDDINLLGLIDLLRRTKDQRQLCVSTHDSRFGNLLARKLRPRSSEQRTIVVELDGWNRSGPTVSVRDVVGDPEPMRLVAG